MLWKIIEYEKKLEIPNITHLTQIFWFWLAKCLPPSKLNERTVPVTFPKNHWRHPCGAKLSKPCGHWLIRMIHWLSFILEEPTNAEKSMQSDSRSTYTVICKYWFRLQTKKVPTYINIEYVSKYFIEYTLPLWVCQKMVRLVTALTYHYNLKVALFLEAFLEKKIK